jgi:formylglycine-generating enzyme required for sulfatase activity
MRIYCLLVVLACCFEAPSYDGTMYKCDVDGICAIGFSCIAGYCVQQETPDDMVAFAAGMFTMGCTAGTLDCDVNAQPAHTVMLSAFAIDKREVTQAQFQQCLQMQLCDNTIVPIDDTTPNAPVRGVRWENAKKYCAFARKQLPTEAQWERAARGGGATPFPWGDAAVDCTHANAQCSTTVVDVTSLPVGATSDGVLHMAGNVREWVADSYETAFYTSPAALSDPRNESASDNGIKVARGGSFKTEARFLKVWYRDDEDELHGGTATDGDDLGVRCAKSF